MISRYKVKRHEDLFKKKKIPSYGPKPTLRESKVLQKEQHPVHSWTEVMEGFRTLAGKPNQDVSDHGLLNRTSQDLHAHGGSEEGLLLPNRLPFKRPSPSPDLEPEGREVAHFHFTKRESGRFEVKIVLSYLVPNFKQTLGKHKQENNVLDLKTFCSHFKPVTNARNMSD